MWSLTSLRDLGVGKVSNGLVENMKSTYLGYRCDFLYPIIEVLSTLISVLYGIVLFILQNDAPFFDVICTGCQFHRSFVEVRQLAQSTFIYCAHVDEAVILDLSEVILNSADRILISIRTLLMKGHNRLIGLRDLFKKVWNLPHFHSFILIRHQLTAVELVFTIVSCSQFI